MTASALALKELLGTIKLEPVTESPSHYEIAALLPVARNDVGYKEITKPPMMTRSG